MLIYLADFSYEMAPLTTRFDWSSAGLAESWDLLLELGKTLRTSFRIAGSEFSVRFRSIVSHKVVPRLPRGLYS